MSPTLDDLVATLPEPGAPPIQLHLHGVLALILQADGATVYVNGPVILRYLQSVAPVLAAAEQQAAGAAIAEANHRQEAASRIRTLAHALHTYGEHAHGCVEGDGTNLAEGCTCGLQLVLDAEPDPYEIGEGQPTSE